MSKIKEGSNSFLLKALTEALAAENAISPEKFPAVSKSFQERVNANDLTKKYPAEVLAHVGTILGRLTPPEKTLDPHREIPISELKLPEKDSNAETYPRGLRGVARATEAAGVAIPPFHAKTNLALDPADIDLLCEDIDASSPPSARGALQALIEGAADKFASSMKHPFIESLMFGEKRYIVVGTATIRSAKKEGVSRSANATVKNYRRIKDADEAILVHVDGRPMCATRELENGVCFVWLLHHVPGLVVRFWLNEADNGIRKDNPKGTYRITLTDTPVGWKMAS